MSPLVILPVLLALGASPPAAVAPGCGAPGDPAAAWCSTLAARPRLPLPTAGDRAALAQVYAAPELRRARVDTAGLRRLVAGLWGRILEALGTAEAERYAGIGRAAFIAAGLAAGVAALAAARRRRTGPRAPRAAPAPERAPLPPADRSAALAREALARGELTAAVRHAFLSALAALERSGRLPGDRTLTNRELAERLTASGSLLAEDFGALGRRFDVAIYGGGAVDAGTARESVERAERIRAAAGGGP